MKIKKYQSNGTKNTQLLFENGRKDTQLMVNRDLFPIESHKILSSCYLTDITCPISFEVFLVVLETADNRCLLTSGELLSNDWRAVAFASS